VDVQPGERIYNPHEQVYLVCTEGGHYLLQTLDNIFFYFGEVPDHNTPAPVQRIENALGHFLHFTYTVDGTLTDISATGGVRVHLEYDNPEYAYDAWGNLTEKRVGLSKLQTFTYDCENRLMRAETMANSQTHSVATYRYDSLGLRVGKTSEIAGQTDHKHFLWQGLRMLREETPWQSSLYIYEPGSYAPLGRVDQNEGEPEQKLHYFHTDQIGTPPEMTDVDG
jgi:uncharacterized protein RhaS with RHS repeats